MFVYINFIEFLIPLYAIDLKAVLNWNFFHASFEYPLTQSKMNIISPDYILLILLTKTWNTHMTWVTSSYIKVWRQIQQLSLQSSHSTEKHRRLVSSVDRAPVCCAGGRGFEPRIGPTVRVVKQLRRMCCLCNYICKWLDVQVFSDKEYKP